MPRLPTYTAKLDGGTISGGRRATPEDAGAVDMSGAARAVRGAAEGMLALKEEDESRKVLVQQAEIRAKYSKRLDEAATSGEDVDKIREELNSDLSRVSEGLVTTKGAETAALHAANTGAVFDNQANNIKVTRAVTQARVDGAKFINGLAVQVGSDPTSLKANEESVDAFVNTLTNVPAPQRQLFAKQWKQQLNVSAVRSVIRNNPEQARLAVEAGQFDLSPEQREDALGYVEQQKRAIRQDQEYERAQKDRELRERDETAFDKHVKAIMTGGGSLRAILDDADLRPRSREHLAMFQEQRIKALAGQERKSDPAAVRDLWLRINAPDGTPGKIYTGDAIFEAVKAGKVNTTDANQLNAMVAGQKDENNRSFGQRLHGRIQSIASAMRGNPEYMTNSGVELASAIQNQLIATAEKKAVDLRKEGKNPDGLLDPESKDYLFKPGFLKSVEDDVKAQRRAAQPNIVDLSKTPDAVGGIAVGDPFVDPRGVRRTMTKELQAALKKAPGTAAPAPNDLQDWIRATGGALKPGQTQDQAIAEWKAGRK